MKTWRKIFAARRMEILYLVFGVATTIVNYGLFWGMDRLSGGKGVLLSNLVAFVGATLFAYLTNKVWVFHSTSWKISLLLREAAAFFSARLFSFGVEEFGLYLADSVLRLGLVQLGVINGVMAAKIVLSFVAVILNYFFSRFLVFAHGARQENSEEGDR